jgi:lysyl-tRNA synthetase class 2
MSENYKYSKIEKLRLAKLEGLRDKGFDPFPARAERSHTNQDAAEAFVETEEKGEKAKAVPATLVGRLRSLRSMGKITFAHIEDGTGSIQLFLRANDLGAEKLELFSDYFDLGDFVQAKGELFRTRAGEISLNVSDFHMLAKAVTPLPAAKDEEVDGEIVRHAALTDPETRYRQRYADLAVNPDIREVFRVRAAINRALRQFLDDKGFVEVETPILQPVYGGAAARPFVTHHNQLKQELYLRIAVELYLKRLLVGNIERVYELGRDFRNEGVDRTHNPEFTMLEFYMAYADYNQVMDLTEEMLAFTASEVLGTAKFSYQGTEIDLGVSWPRIELREGIAEFAGIEIDEYPEDKSLAKAMRAKGIEADMTSTRGKLIDDLLGEFLEPKFIQPTFLYNYPREISPLAKAHLEKPGYTERFEGFMGGFEICNAFTELNDPLDQEARFIEMGRSYEKEDEEHHPVDEDYLKAMRYGMPPTGGFGMGVDRLTMLFTDKASIREVILFPHLRRRED